MALRGAATYHGLLCRVNLRLPHGDEGMEHLSLAIARKTMDYILISCTLCRFTHTIFLPETSATVQVADDIFSGVGLGVVASPKDRILGTKNANMLQ